MSLSPPDPTSSHLDRRLDTWEQVVTAAAAGALDEDHHVELKQDVPAKSGPGTCQVW